MKHFSIIALIVLFGTSFFTQSCKDDEKLDPLPVKDTTITFIFSAKWNGDNIIFNQTNLINQAGDTLGFSKMKILFSNILFQRMDDSYDTIKDLYGYLDMVNSRRTLDIENLPRGDYKAIKFYVGLDSSVNYGDPAKWSADHALNPLVNGMHWSWAGGYQVNSIEGDYMDTGKVSKFSYHVATPEYFREYEFAVNLKHDGSEDVYFDLNAEQYFQEPNTFSIKKDGDLSHSSQPDDPVMDKVFANTVNLFKFDYVE